DAAKRLRKRLYPDGVGAITQRSFEEQLGLVDAMLHLLEGELAPDVRLVHLERHVRHMREQADALLAELARPEPEYVTYDQVRACDGALHEALCEVAVAILFETRTHTLADK